MKPHTLPSLKTLISVWAVLMLATIATMFSGKVSDITSIGPVWMALLLFVTYVKATLILGYYLDLKSATAGWNIGFNMLVAAILIVTYAMYLFGIYF